MEKYIIKHKIEGYTGKEACIVFSNGIGETDSLWIASWFERKGYEVKKESEEQVDNQTDDQVEKEDGIIDYSKLKLEELKEIAKDKGIEGYSELKKAELIEKLG